MQDLIDRLREALDRLFPVPAPRPVPIRVPVRVKDDRPRQEPRR